MKYMVVGLLFWLLMSNISMAETQYPAWSYAPDKGVSSYCIPITGSIDVARESAVLFAGLEIQKITKSIASGSEKLEEKNGAAPKFQQSMEVADFSDEPDVTLVKEVVVGNELCVLVN